MHSTEDALALINANSKDHLPGLVGIHFTAAGDGWLEAELPVRQRVMAPNGFLHAASVSDHSVETHHGAHMRLRIED